MIETSEQVADLIASLVKAQSAMDVIRKEKNNPAFKSKYADLATVLAAVMPALNDNDIILSQPVTNGEDGSVTVTTILWHKSGQFMRARLSLRPVQNTPQGFGSAATYCRRYSLLGILGVAPDEDDDANAASHRPQHNWAPATSNGNGQKLGVQSLHQDDPERAKQEMPLPSDDAPDDQVARISAFRARKDKVWEGLMAEMDKCIDADHLLQWGALPETIATIRKMPLAWQADFREVFADKKLDLKSKWVMAG